MGGWGKSRLKTILAQLKLKLGLSLATTCWVEKVSKLPGKVHFWSWLASHSSIIGLCIIDMFKILVAQKCPTKPAFKLGARKIKILRELLEKSFEFHSVTLLDKWPEGSGFGVSRK